MYRVIYLHHSGFLVETEHSCLIFDYYTQNGKYDFISIDQYADKNIYVFVSHVHEDHFDQTIFRWKDQVPSIHYILSDDISVKRVGAPDKTLRVHWNKQYKLQDVVIETLHSTDEGVAFVVTVDDITIYHAGDLNWWHWNEEPEEFNHSIAQMYQKEIRTLRNRKIDVAFVPVDLRLKDKYILGLDYFVKQALVEHIFPMHFWRRFEICRKLLQDERSVGYREKLVILEKSNEEFTFD